MVTTVKEHTYLFLAWVQITQQKFAINGAKCCRHRKPLFRTLCATSQGGQFERSAAAAVVFAILLCRLLSKPTNNRSFHR